VLLSHSTVEVEKALNGDKNSDVALKPGDVVSIRQLAGWQDIGGSVTVSGEVEHPGAMGFNRESGLAPAEAGRRVSRGAYPGGAVQSACRSGRWLKQIGKR